MLKGPTFSATGSSFGQRTEDTAVETRASAFNAAQLAGFRFSQNGHELKVYNSDRRSLNSDAKFLMQ
jgi:hypothetical protein